MQCTRGCCAATSRHGCSVVRGLWTVSELDPDWHEARQREEQVKKPVYPNRSISVSQYKMTFKHTTGLPRAWSPFFVMPDTKPLLLVVDDEATVLKYVSTVFHLRGYRFMMADSGERGLALFHDDHAEIGMVMSRLGNAANDRTGDDPRDSQNQP